MGPVVVLNLKTASSESCILWHFQQTFANAEQIKCRRAKTHLTLHLPVNQSLANTTHYIIPPFVLLPIPVA